MDPDRRAELLLERARHFALLDRGLGCRRFILRQSGEIRSAPDKPWLTFGAEQWFDAEGLDFCWTARARIFRVLPITVVDAFQGGRGLLSVRLGGVIPVARTEGAEVDRGEVMRSLAELPWHPTGLARKLRQITWSAPGPETLRASFDDGRTPCYVDFELDLSGRVLSASAPDRARTVGKRLLRTPWRGEFSDYKRFGGILVPTRAEVAWLLPEGAFPYFRAVITAFEVAP